MNLTTTHVFKKNLIALNEGYDVIANKGGARSSKTWSVLQALILIAESNRTRSYVITVVSMTYNHLATGAIRDFKEIMGDDWDKRNWNGSTHTYRFGKAVIEFLAVDRFSKAKGPARNILYVNEANHIPYETYRQLATRTSGPKIIDYNPNSEFWFEKKILGRDKGVRVIHSTYKDNNYLSEAIVREIESYKDDVDYWRVYGLGLTGSRVGCCITNWSICNSVPAVYKLRGLGIDFGFTNDPTTVVDIYFGDDYFTKVNEKGEKVRVLRRAIWVDEVLYERGLTNPQIHKRLVEKNVRVEALKAVADSAEQKSIRELNNMGMSVEGADKWAGSVVYGIELLNRFHIYVTSRSKNIINELQSYKWKVNNDGEPTNEPDKSMHVDHTIDAIRYWALKYLTIKGGRGSQSFKPPQDR